jgi:hypothetical protein
MLAARGATVEFTLCCGYDHKSPRRKPSGGMLREALARYGAAPAETPFIGDRLTTSRRLSTPGAGMCSSAQALAARRGDGLPQCSPVAVHDDLAAVREAVGGCGEGAMPELHWVGFIRLHPGAHLVTASVMPPRTAPHLSRPRRLFNQLIRERARGGDFATAIVRVTDIAELHYAFTARGRRGPVGLAGGGACRASAWGAEAGGWSSYRTFRPSAAKEVALAGLF